MSTEKSEFLKWMPRLEPMEQRLQKGRLNIPQIQHDDRHGDAVGDGFFQLRHNQSDAAFAFGQAEAAFDLNTLAFIPILLDHSFQVQGFVVGIERERRKPVHFQWL